MCTLPGARIGEGAGLVQGFGALEELEEANARLLTWKVTAETKAETISQQAEDGDRSSEVLVVNQDLARGGAELEALRLEMERQRGQHAQDLGPWVSSHHSECGICAFGPLGCLQACRSWRDGRWRWRRTPPS